MRNSQDPLPGQLCVLGYNKDDTFNADPDQDITIGLMTNDKPNWYCEELPAGTVCLFLRTQIIDNSEKSDTYVLVTPVGLGWVYSDECTFDLEHVQDH